MLPKFRSFVRLIIRSFVRSFVVPIHRSSFVHSSYPSVIVRSSSLFIVRSYDYSLSLFTITIHRYYSHTLFIIVTIYHYYSSSLLFIDDVYNYFSVATIHRHYSSLLFIDHPITPNFNYSSIMLSSPPKTSQTHVPVIRTPVTVIFLLVETCHTRVSGHQDPGANIITRCAGTKSHTYNESWHRIECHIFTI
jgi:hypothetical protein